MKLIEIAFDLGHPAHYLTFRDVLKNSYKLGFKPFIFIQEKDILKDLLSDDDFKFIIRRNKGTTASRISLLPRDILYLRKLFKNRKIISNFAKCSPVGSIVSRSLNRRAIQLDDTEHATGQIFLFRKTATEIWTPQCYFKDLGAKHKKYQGLNQLAYLDPSVFKPDKSIPHSYGLLDRGKPIIIRIIKYQAAHDWKYRNKIENFDEIIKKVDRDFDIILSIESRDYPKKWVKYIKNFTPSEYHHILAHSKLYIGSGASSAAEAAVLGVPSIYTNYETTGFIMWLEEKYGIVKSIKADLLNLENVNDFLEKEESEWKNVQKKILNYCINVPDFIRNLIKREIEIYNNQ